MILVTKTELDSKGLWDLFSHQREIHQVPQIAIFLLSRQEAKSLGLS